MVDHEKHCNCLFCNARCPNCGSVNIHVEFLARYSFRNNEPDRIIISHDDNIAKVFCMDCGDHDIEEEWGFELWELEDGLDNGPLALSVDSSLDLRGADLSIDENKKITGEPDKFVVRPADWEGGTMIPGPAPGKVEK